jgi:nitrogen fixation NifU-like protein
MYSREYSELVIEHFANPRRCAAMSDADGQGIAVSPGCGDRVWIYIRMAGELISDISFQACGCPSVIACASMLTDMACGKHLDDAAQILDEHLAQALELPEHRKECSAIAAVALHEAIYDYVFRHKERKAHSGEER